jgi:hypothetical protein
VARSEVLVLDFFFFEFSFDICPFLLSLSHCYLLKSTEKHRNVLSNRKTTRDVLFG